MGVHLSGKRLPGGLFVELLCSRALLKYLLSRLWTVGLAGVCGEERLKEF